MTTIAFKAGIIAADRCANTAESKTPEPMIDVPKLYRIKDSLIGVAGSMNAAQQFIRWFERGVPDQYPQLSDFRAIEWDGNNLKVWSYVVQTTTKFRGLSKKQKHIGYVPLVVHNQFYSIGSSSWAAIGAMYAGASAEEAVKIASKVDVYTGSTIDVLAL